MKRDVIDQDFSAMIYCLILSVLVFMLTATNIKKDITIRQQEKIIQKLQQTH